MSIDKEILKLLDSWNIIYETKTHEKATTCMESAKARGSELKIGAKTLLFKDKWDFRLFVISAEKDVDNKKVRKILKSDKLRFASIKELRELAGVEKGSLPPLGQSLYPFKTFVDVSLTQNELMTFNAGIPTFSVIMKVQDYLLHVKPEIVDFSKEITG